MVNRTSSGQEYRSSVTSPLRFVFLSFLTLLLVALAACGGSSSTITGALDAASGNEIWPWQDPQPKLQGIDQQPTVYNDTVYISTVPGIGVTSFYQGGQVGVLYALDEQTGNVKWSFNTVKDGNLWGNPQVNSGGGAWYPPDSDNATGPKQ